jgi:hypothetical protein
LEEAAFDAKKPFSIGFLASTLASSLVQLFQEAGQKLMTRSKTPSRSQSDATKKLLTR